MWRLVNAREAKVRRGCYIPPENRHWFCIFVMYFFNKGWSPFCLIRFSSSTSSDNNYSGKKGKKRKDKQRKRLNKPEEVPHHEADKRTKHSQMTEYDKAADLTPSRKVLLNSKQIGTEVIVYDLETSGLSSKHGEILQVCCSPILLPTHICL